MLCRRPDWCWPLLVGLLGWSAVAVTRADPGFTSDEPFTVLYGKDYVTRLCDQGRGFFTPVSINETFATRSEHPPLGRWITGWVHWLLDPQPKDSEYIDIRSARMAPATMFALMLVLLTRMVARQHGKVAGVAAGVSLILMPRVFADAHFAALDTAMSCTYFLGVLSAAWMMERRLVWAPFAGILLGCALLTKMHGVFLFPLIAVWALVFYRLRGVPALALWAAVGVVIFLAGWQWLWNDVAVFWTQLTAGKLFVSGGLARLPQIFARLSAYLGSSMDRQAIYVTYMGKSLRDTEIPWHYPWVLFTVTVPVGLHVLGLCGLRQQIRRGWSDPRGWLYLGAAGFPLLVFSIPRVPVYDGVRLFSMVFPFWAAFVGQGAGWAFEWLQKRWRPRWAAVALVGFFACQSFGVVYYHPFQLSYYNLLVGGLRGAEKLGFEVTYWGDAVTSGLIDRWAEVAPEHSCAVLVPTLYSGQSLLYDTALTRKKGLKIQSSLRSRCPYLIVYNRQSYLGEVQSIVADPKQQPLAENVVDGVWVSRVYVRPGAADNKEKPFQRVLSDAR